ncbi:peptidylprolyl isomerase [Bartonella sp. DGB1]|uniref:peptidylprolyl isomerase n=1 Tax=Bartonella sp. DGB1 TaxID=3239807 RepID=UPI0035253F2C
MNKISITALITAGLLATANPSITFAEEKNKTTQQQKNALSDLRANDVVATVGKQRITVADLDAFINKNAPNLNSLEQGLRRAVALRSLITTRSLLLEAEKSPYARSNEYKNDLKDVVNDFLVREYVAKEVNKLVTPARLQELYKTQVVNSPEVVLYRAHHILAKNEEDAKKALEQLKAGKKFEEVAEIYSIEKDNVKGGDLGLFSKDKLLADLHKTLDELSPGKYNTTPIKTSHGWHIIRLDETRKPTFEEVKPQLESLILREEYPKVLENLVKKAESAISVKYTNNQVEKAVKDLNNL